MLRFLVFLFCFLIATDVEAMRFPEHPPIPADYENEQEIAIVEVVPSRLRHIEEEIRQRFPGVTVRQVYETTLCGLSVKGKRRELERLKQLPGVERITPVSVYKPEIGESVPFIGGSQVRGYYDDKKRRLSGAGVKVGVIDTGIDYQHPDLRRNYAGGYDTVDNDKDPMESTSVGPTLHGSHVAGIIAANGKMQGVAPNARLFAYRALGPGGAGSTETVLAAIERAVKDRVQVLNLSLGNEVNGPDWPTSIALNKAAEKGIVSVVASGNSGPDVWTVGSPGTASKAVSVGASSPRLQTPFLIVRGKELRLTPLSGTEWRMPGAERWAYGGIGKPEQLKDVRGKVALLERGVLPFLDKVQNAERAGARAVIIYNNEPGSFSGSAEGAVIPAAAISRADGEWLRKQSVPFVRTVFHEEEDRIAPFSSRGPVISTWEIKPDVVAPGVNITSTVPGGHLALQGTSMAAPHVAGAAALLKQAHPDWSPDQVKAALMNTAKLLYRGGRPYHIYEQGAGRIQLDRALRPSSLVYPSSLPFGLVHKKESHTMKEITVTVDNQTDKPQTYVFSQPPAERGIQWHMPHTLYIGPHQKKQARIQAMLNPSFLKTGIHEGYVQVRDYTGTIHLPYLFFVEEPNYPRIMGFQFDGTNTNMYKYEIYLPGGADEMGIVLYDPATFQYVDFLDYRQNVTSGMRRQTIAAKQLPKGTYKALVFVRKGQKEDTLETTVTLH